LQRLPSDIAAQQFGRFAWPTGPLPLYTFHFDVLACNAPHSLQSPPLPPGAIAGIVVGLLAVAGVLAFINKAKIASMLNRVLRVRAHDATVCS